MSSINIIDPNDLVNKNIINGIADIQNIRPYFEFYYIERNRGTIQIDDQSIKFESLSNKNNVIRLNGFVTNQNSNYYSTSYSDEVQGNNQKNTFYETFGIKDIQITLDAHRIPEVTIEFLDIRSNVMNDPNSKYRSMFYLPYPIFYLTIKGGYGPAIKYTLLKIKDEITPDDSGSMVIKSKFVGDRFSSLADVPLRYLKAVPFLRPQKPNLNDGEITSTFELIKNTKRLYQNVETYKDSKQQVDRINTISDLENKKSNLENLYNEFINIFNNYIDDYTYPEINNSSNIRNVLKNIFVSDDKIYFKYNGETPLVCDNILQNFVLTTQKNITDLDSNYKNIILFKNINIYNSFYGNTENQNPSILTITDQYNSIIDFKNLFKLVNDVNEDLKQKTIQYNNEFNKNLLELSKQQFISSENTTIKGVFDVILDDFDYLMKLIQDAGDAGDSDDARYNNILIPDRIGFPTVIQNGNFVYPGSIKSFKTEPNTWPEIRLVENFINGLYESYEEDIITDTLREVNDGKSKYLILNPHELKTDGSFVTNTYNFDNKREDLNSLFTKIKNRFLIMTNINNNNSLFDDVGIYNSGSPILMGTGGYYQDYNNTNTINKYYIEIEALNISYAIFNNQKYREYFKNNTVDTIFNFVNTNILNNYPQQFNYVIDNFNEITYTLSPIAENTLNYFTDIFELDIMTEQNTQSEDIVSRYIKEINKSELNYKLTKNGLVYLEDDKLNTGEFESNYHKTEFDSKTYIKYFIEFNKNNTLQQTFVLSNSLTDFDIKKFNFNLKTVGCYQIPLGLILNIGDKIRKIEIAQPNQEVYNIDGLFVYINSPLYNQIMQTLFDFYSKYEFTNQGLLIINNPYNEILNKIDKELFKPYYFIYGSSILKYNVLNTDLKFKTNEDLFNTYFKKLILFVKNKIDQLTKTIDTKTKEFKSVINDNEYKLEVYKSFQLIYETYLARKGGYNGNTKNDFSYFTRTYRDIGYECIIDLETLINDFDDSNTDVLSTLGRLLSANNFWYYPFQTFTTFQHGNSWKDLFKIDTNIYSNNEVTSPKFVCIFVGGLSTNANSFNSDIKNDGFDDDTTEMPPDYNLPDVQVNAFIVKYTGLQNQIIFNNFQHSTDQFKNTDESIRIGSDIINNGTKSFSYKKGQSMLSLYSKRSYSSTISIPFGNIGIQPTQYYLQKYIPLFDGFYIIYNVTHKISSSDNMLVTTFKGYRLNKNTLPIIKEPVLLFTKFNYFSNIANKYGYSELLTDNNNGASSSQNKPILDKNDKNNYDKNKLDKAAKELTLDETNLFYKKLLEKLNAPLTEGNLIFLKGWRQMEGGKARYNPFNTTLYKIGSTIYGTRGEKNYISLEQGIEATYDTLINTGSGSFYKNIVSYLRKGIFDKKEAQNIAEKLQVFGKDLHIWVKGPRGKEKLTGYVAAVLKGRVRDIPIYGNI